MTFDIAEGEPALRKLGRLLYEAAGQFYLDAARRRLSLHAERRSQTPELNARVAFKVCFKLSVMLLQPSKIEEKRDSSSRCCILGDILEARKINNTAKSK